ncbi:MAG: methyltransferase domain-containing protein [Treponema sp.]|nr:methyltransferase domain-containing protein [Treponema sp.]
MNLLRKLTGKTRTVVVVQCRLSSTRLPGKALLPLGNHTVLEWTLKAMHKVSADAYYLATDEASAPSLKEIASRCHYEIFAGSLDDVLDRFCKVIEVSKAEWVIRATADNPFLFYEAANDLYAEFEKRSEESDSGIDYMTFTGLPHGSGVEMFKASSLLDAASKTKDPYDHEHVGPALYNHQDTYKCEFIQCPEEYNYPDLRTTIDTKFDYIRAQKIVDRLSKNIQAKGPYSAKEILSAFESPAISNPMLFIPSTEKGRGTGHLHRCLQLALETGGDIYIPEKKEDTLDQCGILVDEALQNGLHPYQVVDSLDCAGQYSLAVCDNFITSSVEGKMLSSLCPVLAMDEGAEDTTFADYLLDIIPSMDMNRRANCVDPSFIPLPKKRRSAEAADAKIHTAIVVLGGEDPSSLSIPAARALAAQSVYVTVVCPGEVSMEGLESRLSESDRQFVKVVPPIRDLKEKLSDYDLVVTHYGFTAFEASAANCAVILLGTTPLHEALAEKYNFVCLGPEKINEDSFKELMQKPARLHHGKTVDYEKNLSEYLVTLSQGKRILCPVCRCEKSLDPVVARIKERTFRRCRKCGMLYQSWTVQSEQTVYNHDYFYDNYEKQYGKTYLDDFASIKTQGVRRTSVIDMLYRRNHSSVTPTILDIGCAMGPFLSAANDAGWQVFGTDVSQDAVDYVQNQLHFPATCSAFPEIDVAKEFGVEAFDAVTMWYVIEHFQDLNSVLEAISKIVKKGGVFAFSTPSASGVSAKYNTQTFFEQSPSDHYTLWEPNRADSILRRYGFKVYKIVPTGIHPERFPKAKKKNLSPSSLQFKMFGAASRLFKLGDTFEVYCKKVK